jgi:rubrerythrin
VSDFTDFSESAGTKKPHIICTLNEIKICRPNDQLWLCIKVALKQEQETIKSYSYRERIRQAERSGEFALSEALRDIIVQEQDHEIDLKDALGL